MSDTNTCLNKHSDFSVQPKPTHYEACGNMASLKLQGDSNLKEEAVALLKIEEAYTRGMTLHEYIWSIFKQVRHYDEEKRNRIYLNIVGDYNNSLLPTARNNPKRTKQDQKPYESL